MRGNDGDDRLNGAGGDDIIYGGDGHDTIYGGDDNDMIFGSSGDNLLTGEIGSDLLLGGDGADIFVIQSDSKVDIFRDFVNGVDRLGLANQLSLEDLNIVAEGNSTLIQDLNSNTLAFLSGVDSSLINSNDFTTIQLNIIS